MEKLSNTMCPVCHLYLRKDITLRNHLQTHSKEKVIEALLHNDSASTSACSPISDFKLNSDSKNISRSSFITINQNSISSSSSTSFMNNERNQAITFGLQFVNGKPFTPIVNNVVSQTSVGSTYSATLSYQTQVTNDGKIPLVPAHNMCSSSVVVSNVAVPDAAIAYQPMKEHLTAITSIFDSTVNSSRILSIRAPPRNEDLSQLSSAVQSKNVDLDQLLCVPVSPRNENVIQSSGIQMSKKNVSAVIVDENVTQLSIGSKFYSSEPAVVINKEVVDVPELICSVDNSVEETVSENTEIDSETFFDEKVECDELKLNENDEKSNEKLESRDYFVKADSEPIFPIHHNSMQLADTDSMQSKSKIVTLCKSISFENDTIDFTKNGSQSILFFPKKEDTNYIFKPDSDGDFLPIIEQFVDYSNFEIFSHFNGSVLSNSISVSENDLSADSAVFSSSPRKYTSNKLLKVDPCDDSSLTSEKQIEEMENDKDFQIDINSSHNNWRNSSLNIVTDELMPASGELSEQESLSRSENTFWVQDVGFQSTVTKVNKVVEDETENANIISEYCKLLVPSTLRKKSTREFLCFFCKENFTTWKLRQTHLVEKHAYEDSPTVEMLFCKRSKLVNENGRPLKEETPSTFTDSEDVETISVESEHDVICRLCSEIFKTGWIFLTHLSECHNIKKRSLVCPTCFVQFDRLEDYRQHIRTVHPYECMTCGKQFFTWGGYVLHQKHHMKIKPYTCDLCDKSFVTKQKLAEHFNIHTGDTPIKCEFCSRQFKRYSNYQQHKKFLHMNIKRKSKDFICNCGEVFHSKTKLKWHREIHDEKPKQCSLCVEKFVHASSLTRHVRKCHYEIYVSKLATNENGKYVACPICNITYLHTSLQSHMKVHNNDRPFSCNECSKSFRSKWNLQLHKSVHMSRSAKPYKCKLCVKAYIHKTDYDAHVRSHNNNRPYSCNVCGRKFIRKYNCLRHMKEHFEPRAFKCDTCGKMFSRSYYLTEHEKVHTGAKPHVCHFCGKTSATKSNHNKHLKMHTAARELINAEI